MVPDFSDQNSNNIPSFFLHLGDVVYSFGQSIYYYDQFYEPYRDYPARRLQKPGRFCNG